MIQVHIESRNPSSQAVKIERKGLGLNQLQQVRPIVIAQHEVIMDPVVPDLVAEKLM